MRSASRRYFSFAVVILCVLAFPFLFWLIMRGMGVGEDKRDPDALAPPASVKNFQDYLEWRPKTKHFETAITREGAVVIIAEGRWLNRQASGPAAYLFAANGQFLEWTDDSGDGFWVDLEQGNSVNTAEALQLVTGKVSESDWRARHFPP